MKFLVDAQLPPALAAWIVERGHEAQHVAYIGMVSATDEDLWRLALKIGAVVAESLSSGALVVEASGS